MEKFIQQLVKDAGRILKNKFEKVGVHHTKSNPLDVVTAADLAAEKLIIGRIKKKFPKHQIISEESGDNNLKSDECWIIDPLDGTLNFSKGIPTFVSQVAFMRKNKIVLGAIYDPIHNKLFFAKKGKGAFLNGKRIRCSQNSDFEHSIGSMASRIREETVTMFKKILVYRKGYPAWLRSTGSTGWGASYTANGNFDWFFARGGHIWDYAPLYLLIKEAGGVAKNFKGKEWSFNDDNFIAGNPSLVGKVLKIMNKK